MIAVNYAFPPYYLHRFEQQIDDQFGVHAHCIGIHKVEMRDGSVGYKLISCTAELDNPGLVWQFRINQKTGKIVAYAIA